MSLEELMNQEVTSVSRRSEKLSEAPSSIQVITGEDIRRSGASSLPEALRLASNLQVSQVNTSNWSVSARGFSSTASNKMLVLIDGRSVYSPLFAGVFWDVQDVMLEDVDRIEVISGPGATQWGANAVNGVINVTTKSAKDTQGLMLTGGGGTELRDFAGVRYGGALAPTLHYRVYGKYFERDNTVLAAGPEAHDERHMAQGGMRMDWDASASDLITLQGDLYGGETDVPLAGDVTRANPDEQVLGGGNVLSRYTHTISDRSDVKLQFYFDRTHRRIPDSITDDVDTYDIDYQHRFPIGDRNDVVWGLGYRAWHDDIENPPTFAILPAHETRERLSSFVQDTIAVVRDELDLTLGSRFSRNDYTGWEVQPSARLAWQAAEDHMLWTAVSRSVRTPSRIDADLFSPRDPPFTVSEGNSDFETEKVWSYELGYRAQALERLTTSLSLFYNDYDDLRSVEQVNPPAATPLMIANGLKGYSYGAEATGDAQITDWWRLGIGYTELRIHIEPKPGSTDTTNGSNEAQDSNHHVLARSSMDLPRNFEFDVTFRYVSKIINRNVPSYGEADVRIGWQPQSDLELSVVGQNLIHDHHAEFGSPATRYEVERSAYAKVVWNF